ncbi:MAG: ABC transporter ATP-binding protein [Geminicoccaceae bacterium]
MAELRLEGLTKRFGAVTAVDGLDLVVADGELLVLLGASGAGKTTTLRLVAGLERPDAGRVLIGGRDLTAGGPAERDVAFVFQQYSLYPHYTVYDNLAFPLRSPLRRLPEDRIRARVGAIAEMLRISAKLGNKATRLSGGEMQRVAIGRALVREPACFLMDEPLSSLDAKLREDLRIELKRIQRELGATILYVTHDQVEAMTLGDRIGVLEAGRLTQVATPRALYERPATSTVARRLGSPPINLVPPGLLGLSGAGLPPGTALAGVRPEDVRLVADGPPVRVAAVEALGAETVLLLDIGGAMLHALVAGTTTLAAGASGGLGVAPERVLFFDAAGRRLDTGGSRAG